MLALSESTPTYLAIAPAHSSKVGQSVFTLGCPTTSILGDEPKFTDGSISALSGPGGEQSLMQISVPIQPGNSGGPLINDRGEVIGVVAATAAIMPFLKASGSLPQNINWAVKAEYGQLLFLKPEGSLQPSKSRQEAIEFVRQALCQWALTREEMKNCIWLKPQLLAQIQFTEWMPDGHLRHSKFAGLRDDKAPREVVLEG